MREHLRRTVICAIAACVMLSVSACEMTDSMSEKRMKEEETVQIESNPLFDEVGDIMTGPETETELDVIVDDEEATEEIPAAVETESEAAPLPGMETGDGAAPLPETESEAAILPETEPEAELLPGMSPTPETEISYGALDSSIHELIEGREAAGEYWAAAYEDLETGEAFGYHEDDIMQSASVVKLFIMGTVYRYMCYPAEGEEAVPFHEEYDGQLRDTIVSMITVSDNSCANLLIERLGEGDFSLGAQRIAAFCEENGYHGTSIGRRFLEENPSGDNYTTAADTRKFLSDLYHGTCVNEEASAKMLEIVKGQTLKNKIPAGLPAGYTSGNKTGEMPENYGLGCIENDVAIVFPPEGKGEGYILCVLSNDLAGRNAEAISVIVQISSRVAQWYEEQKS